jgi:hypothetical protein
MTHYRFRNAELLRRSAGSKAGLILSAVFAALTVFGMLLSNKAHASTTFTVTNIGDNGGVNPAPGAGTGTLRQAIVDANSTAGTDTIDFNIPGPGVHTITLAATLPAITGTVVIDGYTQPGNGGPNAHPNTLAIGDDAKLLIQLDSSFSPGLNFGLFLSSSGSTVKGLVISRFGDDLVRIDGTGNTIVGNFIGTDPLGTVKVNAIGEMIQVNGSGNTIGGTEPADRNIVAGGGFTVFVPGGADNTVIQGNYIGVDVSGNVALPAAIDGVAIGSNGNTIGGSAAGAGNVIVAISNDNIGLRQGSNNIVEGNLIGTNATGTAALGGVNQGIIGESQVGSATIVGNLISGANIGISIISATSSWTIRGNKIGTDINGTQPIPNNNGILLSSGSSSNVGGTGAGEGNIIAFNSNDGILISGSPTGVSIRGNSIFANGHLGINLIANTDPSPPGVTANDACDIDTGPNNLQNFPIINSAIKSGNNLLIEGTLDSTASSTFTLDFYTNDTCNSLGNGEGKTYLGSANVVTGANCIADFTGANKITITPLAPVASGLRLTATATDANGNTSEFSGCSGPTAIHLVDCTATAHDDGILLEWETAHEVDNLGFNIFREENGNRVRVNRQLIAGSALLVGPSIRLGAGYSYAWKDATPDSRNATYWLEDVDLKGGSTWHGPVSVQRSDLGNHKSEITTAVLLSDVGKEGMRNSSSRLEARAKMEFAAAPVRSQAALASQPAVKIAVKHEGWYRVTQLELAALGVDTRINPRMLQLFVDGRELPIVVQGEQDGSFDPADSVEFYGIGIDSPFTDSRVYWLIAGDRPGLRVIPAKFEGAPSSSESFTANVERRDRTVYFSALRNGEKENFFGAVIATNPVEQHLSLSHLARTTNSSAELEISVQGATLTSHLMNIELNGTWVGEMTFNGQSQGAAKINVAQSLLREGENVVRLSPLGGQSDISLVDYVRVSYQHTYIADGDSLKLAAAGKEQISVDGFASKTIRVFDVTDANSPQELICKIDQTKNGYHVSFSSAADGQRNLLCISNETRPAALAMNLPSSLRDLNASYLIITRRDFFESLNPLVALHQRHGLSVAVIDIEDIYDEFSFGQKTPYAVREFLAQAKTNWKKKTRFVVFAGDASLDPKNYLGLGDSDSVPTKLIDTQFLETSTDDWFTDFNGDGIADIATGRLPARTAEELISIVTKIVQYEQSTLSDEALLVADADEGFPFEQACSELISLIPTNLRITQVYRGRLDPEKARGSLFEALYRKQFLVNYVGHGSVNLWSGNLLTNSDAQDLQNEHLPMFVMMTCLNGYFHDPALDSLGESLIKAERGGAIAVWASSGMTMPSDQALINKELYRLLFNRDSAPTLGEAVMRAKSSSVDSDVRRTWILLGDPAIVLK